jgi:glycosyl transferase family 1
VTLARISGRRVLLVDYHLLVDDVAAVLNAAGAHVRRLYPASLGVDTFAHACREHRPHFVLSVNHAPPLAFLCSRSGVPYVSWTIDPLPHERRQVLPGTKLEQCLCFVHRRKLVPDLLGAGLPRVEYLPLAAASRRVIDAPAEPLTSGSPVTFVGGSLASDDAVLAELVARAGWDAASCQRVDAWLDELLTARGDDPAFMGVDSAEELPDWLVTSVPDEQRTDLCEGLNGRLSYWHRRRVVQALGGAGLVVWGDAPWAAYARDYRGLARHGDQLTSIYRTSLCNVDVPRLYQREIVTLRAFDVLAAGGLLLTEAGGELGALVSPDGYLTYRDPSDLIDRIEHARSDPAAMRDIARAGQRQVLLAHRLEHRVARIVDACAALGWL